jgi:hypothetical protein
LSKENDPFLSTAFLKIWAPPFGDENGKKKGAGKCGAAKSEKLKPVFVT